jgi:O-antigen/teichoic acid export membrane protein
VTALVWLLTWRETFTTDQRMALSALSAGVLLAFAGGLSEQLFKATQRYPLGTMLGNLSRLAEWIGWMLGLLLVGSFTAVAVGGLVFRSAGTVLAMLLAGRDASGMSWGFRSATRETLKQMIRPASAFMAFPIANALSFQGMTLLVGLTLGPVSVAVFNTYRTLARTAVQVTALFSHSLWPEFTRLFGENSHVDLSRLVHRSAWISLGQVVLVCGAVYALAPAILQAWTHGQIAYDSNLLSVLMAYAVVSGAWHVPRILLMSTSRHGWLAIWTVFTSVLGVALAWAFVQFWGIVGMGWSMLISEAAIASVCIVLIWRTLNRPAKLIEAAQ